jgi:hypothetical protein
MKRKAIPLLNLGTCTAPNGKTFTLMKPISKIGLLIIGGEFDTLVV